MLCLGIVIGSVAEHLVARERYSREKREIAEATDRLERQAERLKQAVTEKERGR